MIGKVDFSIDFSTFKEKVADDLAGPSRWIYRGHAKVDWKLESSFLRFCREARIPFDLTFFSRMLDVFLDEASDLLAQDLRGTHLAEAVALAQHHGVPTPFLDWSESPYVAAFFAMIERRDAADKSPFTVWALRVDDGFDDPKGLDSLQGLAVDGLWLRIFRTKVFHSRRLARQMGCFTFIGRGEALEVLVDDPAGPELGLKRYVVDGDNWPAPLAELRSMGLSGATLFDDLDGVAIDCVRYAIWDHLKRRTELF